MKRKKVNGAAWSPLDELTPRQWNLLASCFDSVAFKSSQLEDAMAVKSFLRGVMELPEVKQALVGAGKGKA